MIKMFLVSEKFFKIFIFLFAFFFINFLIGCSNDDDNFESNKSPSLIPNTITGIVDDDPIEGADVYIDFEDGTTSAHCLTEKNGYFKLNLTESDLNKLMPEDQNVSSGDKNSFTIIAQKNEKILRNAVKRDVKNGQIVYITNDTEAYSQFLESTGQFNSTKLIEFNGELIKGRITEDSLYYPFINDIREDIKNYFMNGQDKPDSYSIFSKALIHLGKEEVSIIADNSELVENRNVMSGGEITIPSHLSVESDEIEVQSIGNGKFLLGNGDNDDQKAYLKINNETFFNLIPIEIKKKQKILLTEQTVRPADGVTIGGSEDDINITIPPFALNKEESISINTIETEGETSNGKVIMNMQPSGLTFEIPITIRINYSVLGIENPNKVLWKYGSTENGYKNANVISTDTLNNFVYLQIDHFSDLLVKTINNQEFLDIGHRFISVVSRRCKSIINPFNDAPIENTRGYVYLTNKLFSGMSVSQRAGNTRNAEEINGAVGGGQCAQFGMFYNALKNAQYSATRSESFQANVLWEVFDDLKSVSSEELSPVRESLNLCSRGDLVLYETNLTPDTSHIQIFHERIVNQNGNNIGYSVIESNWHGKERLQINKTHSTTSYGVVLNQDNTFSVNDYNKHNGQFLCVDLLSLTEENSGISTNQEKANTFVDRLSTILRNESFNYSDPGSTYMWNGTEQVVNETPWLYYLLDTINDGIIRVNNTTRYIYNPDLLPITPLKVEYDDQQNGSIQAFEDSRYEIYAEDIENVSETFHPINFQSEHEITIERYHIVSNYFTPNDTWKTRDELETAITDFVNNFPDNEYWVDIYDRNDNQRYCSETYGKGNGYEACSNLGIDGLLSLAEKTTQTTLNISSLEYSTSEINNNFGRLKKLISSDGSNISEFKMISSAATNSWATLEVSNINSPLKVLFSPTVIDDYYISWGIDNTYTRIPIGYWNSYGNEITNYPVEEINDDNKDIVVLNGGRIYQTSEALNSYFMTLENGESAQWHFSLAGIHAIFVHVPYEKREWIDNANYTLLRQADLNSEMIAELEISDVSQKLPDSAFDGWFVLYLKDGLKIDDNTYKDQYGFNFEGNEYLEISANNGIVAVDAIRLQGKKSIVDDLLKLKGQVDLSDANDVEEVMIKLEGTDKISGKVLFEKYINPFSNYLFEFAKNTGSFTIKMLITPIEPLTGKGSTNNKKSITHYNEDSVPIAVQYKPQVQYIDVSSDDSLKNLPKIVLQKMGVKESVKVKIINATNGNYISEANVIVRFGIDREDNSTAYTGTTDDEGIFEIKNMPFGQYSFELIKDGYVPTVLNITVSDNTPSTTDLSLSPVLSSDKIRIRLTWGEYPDDLDSHLVKETNGIENYHIYFNDQTDATSGDNLDLDDTSSYGPETVTVNNLSLESIYTYFVHNYSGDSAGKIKDSGASVKVTIGSNEHTFYPPSAEGLNWKVFTIENGAINPCIENCME